MIRHAGVDYDPKNAVQLRMVATALCHGLEHELGRFDNGEVEFPDLKQLYESAYQRKAYAVAEALLSYVPSSDPRVTVLAEVGEVRRMNSEDLEMIGKPLDEDFAGTQLRLVVQSLRELVDYLPK